MLETYPKIPGPFRRHTEGELRNKLDFFNWSTPELAMLHGLLWKWTEKVDGTNVRVHWDGYNLSFHGRTDNAQMPPKLMAALHAMFPVDLVEQAFKAQEVTLYGEGYGAGIQKGGIYRDDMSFILFDAKIDRWWLERESLRDIGSVLNVPLVPYVLKGTVLEAIQQVAREPYSKVSLAGAKLEGYVGTIDHGLLTRGGERIQVKVKVADFKGVDIDAEYRKWAERD